MQEDDSIKPEQTEVQASWDGSTNASFKHQVCGLVGESHGDWSFAKSCFLEHLVKALLKCRSSCDRGALGRQRCHLRVRNLLNWYFHILQVLNEVSDVVSLKYMPIAPDPLEVKLKGL
jgi:hypothetical protein